MDAHVSLTHINNKEDPIPILPGMFLGYVHPSGEVHIEDSGEWAACPGAFALSSLRGAAPCCLRADLHCFSRAGQDNSSSQCIVGDVPEIWDGDESDHDGPYDGVTMGC